MSEWEDRFNEWCIDQVDDGLCDGNCRKYYNCISRYCDDNNIVENYTDSVKSLLNKQREEIIENRDSLWIEVLNDKFRTGAVNGDWVRDVIKLIKELKEG